MTHLKPITEELHFPSEATEEILRHETYNLCLEGLARRYFCGNLRYADALKLIGVLKHKDTCRETANVLFLLFCAEHLKKLYHDVMLPDEILYDSLDDIRVKLNECKKVKNVWGNFVPDWYERFFDLRRFALGRMQYDYHPYEWGSYTACGVNITEQTTVYSCHIPSNGKPFDTPAVIDSLKRAHAFFLPNLRNGILPVVCQSWLLNPSLSDILPQQSNVCVFARMFHIIKVNNAKGFPDAWRIFGKDYTDGKDVYPAETSMQRAVLSYLKSGHSIGSACGILLFDGEKIL